MNFLNIFEDHVAGIFGATRAPFSFKKLAKQAARDMEDQTLVINGVNTAPALYTILIAADDDPMLAPFYPELSREVREFVKAQAEKRRYVFVGEPLVRFMIDPQLRAGKFSVFAENVDAPTLGRLYEEERAYQNGLCLHKLADFARKLGVERGEHGIVVGGDKDGIECRRRVDAVDHQSLILHVASGLLGKLLKGERGTGGTEDAGHVVLEDVQEVHERSLSV